MSLRPLLAAAALALPILVPTESPADELPMTATGKVQRFKLREEDAAANG